VKTRILPFAGSGVLAIALLGSACDQGKSTAAAADAAPVTSATTTASAPPEPPKPPVVTLDDSSIVVAGDRVDFPKTAGGDVEGRVAGLLSSKPMVSGQTLEVDALRDTSMAHFAIAIEAMRQAKAKGATVKTAKRDRTMGTLKLTLDHASPPPCTAVGMIDKQNAILVWPAKGAVAQRFTHGFAGPDITLGSQALAKLANECVSPFFFVSADDSIKWGVVFDLALATSQVTPFRPTAAAVLTRAPVAGRKVTDN
jgi:hypothetical protein